MPVLASLITMILCIEGKKKKKKQLHVIFFLNTQTQDMNPKAQDMLRNGKDSTDKPTKLDQ